MKSFRIKSILFRVFLLVISLTGVLWTLRYTQNHPQMFNDIFNGPSKTTKHLSMPAQNMRPFRLCESRILSIEFNDGSKIFEDKTQAKARWMSQIKDSAAIELDYIEIEKWFGINCVIKSNPLESFDFSNSDHIKIQFVDGKEMLISTNPNSNFEVQLDSQKSIFHSNELSESLNELRSKAHLIE